jgi:DNA-binding CsgD family transcriptional regulator
LSRSDLEGALGFVREAGDLDGTDPFPEPMLAVLADLVGRDCYVGYGEVDRVNRRAVYLSNSDGPPDEGNDDVWRAYWQVAQDHPIRRHRKLSGSLDALKIYDFVTPTQLRRTQWWADFLRPGGAENGFWMSVCLPAPVGHTRTFTLIRDSADFGERERTLLNLLQPHLVQQRQSTEVRRRARATIETMPDGVLSDRELEVLLRVAKGMRNHEIARTLWIAPGTVHKHLDNIYAKLGVHNRAAAAAALRQNGGSPTHPAE